MKLRALSVLCFFLAAQASWGAESSPVGACQIQLNPKVDTYVSVNFTRTPEYQGAVASLNADSGIVQLGNNPAWASNCFAYDEVSQPKRYYAKFMDGALEGEWFDIRANTEDTLTLLISAEDLAKVEVGDNLQIIPYWTLDTLFPEGGVLDKVTSGIAYDGGTIVFKYTNFNDGVVEHPKGVNIPASKSFYYFAKSNCWKSGVENAGSEIIEPNAVLKFRQQKNYSINVPFVGAVPMSATVFNVKTETDHQDYRLAVPTTTKVKLSDLTPMLISTGIIEPSTSRDMRDILFLYDNSKQTLNPSATDWFFFLESTSKWYNSKQVPSDDVEIASDATLMIRKKPQDAQTVIKGKFTPEYLTNQ